MISFILPVLAISSAVAIIDKRAPGYKLQIEYSGETFFDGLVYMVAYQQGLMSIGGTSFRSLVSLGVDWLLKIRS